jgi:hypothetical protein
MMSPQELQFRRTKPKKDTWIFERGKTTMTSWKTYLRRSLFAFLISTTLAISAFAMPDDTIPNDQSRLQPIVNQGGKEIRFNWPMLRTGTAEYREGPTGVTVFRFDRKVLGAVDVRGEPATANTDFLRLGRDIPTLDAVVFSGGSFYGLESTTAVATAIKDDQLRTGALGDVAHVTGAIIYDLGDRRLNEVYPDKRLAQAAFRGARESVFRVGSAGAGRSAKTGYFFGLNAYSGQGGAYYEKGNLKIPVLRAGEMCRRGRKPISMLCFAPACRRARAISPIPFPFLTSC